MSTDITYFLEVQTAYGVAGYFSSQEKKMELFNSAYSGIMHINRRYEYDQEAGGDKIYTIYYKDNTNYPAFATNNKEVADSVQKKFYEMGLSDDEMVSTMRLNVVNDMIIDIMDGLNMAKLELEVPITVINMLGSVIDNSAESS
jgi:hypothetical protein